MNNYDEWMINRLPKPLRLEVSKDGLWTASILGSKPIQSTAATISGSLEALYNKVNPNKE